MDESRDPEKSDQTAVVLAATDGSPQATAALREGLAVVRRTGRLIIVTVIPPVDMSLVVGSGVAGGVMSLEQKQRLIADDRDAANEILSDAIEQLDVPDAETEILEGDPGREICRAALDNGACVIVVGSRGRGGVARFVLGSVSDYVVRNAPCPVVTVG